MTHVPNHSNNRHPRAVVSGPEAPADRVGARPFARREGVVDDRDGDCRLRIAGIKVASREDRHSHCAKVAGRDDLVAGRRAFAAGWKRPAFDCVRRREIVATDGQGDSRAGIVDVGKTPDRRKRVVVERRLLRLRLGTRPTEEHVEGQKVLRVDTSIDMAQRRKAPEEKHRADHERQGDSELERHEDFAAVGRADAG